MAIGKRGVVFGCLTVGAVVIGGAAWIGMSRIKPKEAEARSFEVTRGDIVVDVVESGTVEAVRWVDVRPRTGGRVYLLNFQEGQSANAGDVLAVIDPQETRLIVNGYEAQHRSAESRLRQARQSYEADLKAAQADVTQAESRFRQAKQEWDAQPELTRTAIEQAKASLDSSVEELRILKDSTIPQEILDADSRVKETKAALVEAEAEYNRKKGLLDRQFVSQRDVEAARAAYDTAKVRHDSAVEARRLLDTQHPARLVAAQKRVEQAQASYDQAKANNYLVGIRKEAYDAAQAALEAARARLRGVLATREQIEQAQAGADQIDSQLADARRQLNETEIRSPMTGLVTKRYVQVGDLVTALSSFTAGDPVYRIADLSELKVVLKVNEVDVTKLKLGQRVEVTVDAVRGATFDGEVVKIAPASETPSGATSITAGSDSVVKFEVEVRLSDPDGRLKPGMSARCRIITAQADNVLLLAAEAVGKEPKAGKDEYFGMRLTGKKKIDEKTHKPVDETVRAPLQIGLIGVTKYQVISGAKEGEKFAKAPYGGPKRKELNIFGPEGEEEEQQSEER